jgi:tetratricopeptide (TPR) repeat protein
MSILEKVRNAFGSKEPIKKAESLYQKGLKAIDTDQFGEAISALEEGAKLNPQSAPIHIILAFSYTGIAGEYESDEVALNSWMNKAADTYWKAITLHRQHGGLDEKQWTKAMEIVAMVDRIKITQSNVPPEEERKKIFFEYKSKMEFEFDPFAAMGDIWRSDSLSSAYRSLQQHSGNAEDKAIQHLMSAFGINERQLRAIIQEGENKE